MLAELWCPCWQWCARTPNNVGTCSASWGRVQPIRHLDTMCNARAWPQRCWKIKENQRKIFGKSPVQTDQTLFEGRSSYTRNFCSCEKKAWKKKVRLVRASNPWSLRYRSSALPIKLTSQLGTGSNRLLELVVELVCYKPVKGWWCEYNCDDLPSNDSSLRKKKKSYKGLHSKKRNWIVAQAIGQNKNSCEPKPPTPFTFLMVRPENSVKRQSLIKQFV